MIRHSQRTDYGPRTGGGWKPQLQLQSRDEKGSEQDCHDKGLVSAQLLCNQHQHHSIGRPSDSLMTKSYGAATGDALCHFSVSLYVIAGLTKPSCLFLLFEAICRLGLVPADAARSDRSRQDCHRKTSPRGLARVGVGQPTAPRAGGNSTNYYPTSRAGDPAPGARSHPPSPSAALTAAAGAITLRVVAARAQQIPFLHHAYSFRHSQQT